MRKWALPIAAALAVAVVGPGLAGAKGHKTKTCTFDVMARVATVKVTSGNPPASGSDIDAGTVDGKFCGKTQHGALRSANKYPMPGKFTQKVESFGPLGAFKASGNGTGTVNPNGSISFSGSGKITGGTGIYKQATGTYSFTGSAAKNSTVAVQHITGNVKY